MLTLEGATGAWNGRGVETSSSREQRRVGDIPDQEFGPFTYFYIVSVRTIKSKCLARPGKRFSVRDRNFAATALRHENVQNCNLLFKMG